MSSVQNHKLNFDPSPSFEDVSKLFPLPLSEAAEILGVSTSVLKKLCNENGLERWPHRKYLAGKSIEEIKKEAAKQKNKAPGGISQTGKQKNNAGSHIKEKTVKSAPEIFKSQGNALQPGSKTTYTWRPHQQLGSGLAAETSDYSDEFKYGFPSSGLSKSTNRWWGTGCDGSGASKRVKANSVAKDALEAQVHDSTEQKTDSIMECSGSDEREKVSLSSIRKRALDEGQRALKSGFLKKYGVDQLEKEEKILLQRLFQSS